MNKSSIIDNRAERLLDFVNEVLAGTEKARFAVGYFFISGFNAIRRNISYVNELKLLIGNTSNKNTIEQLAEGYKSIDLLQELMEEKKYAKRIEVRKILIDVAENMQSVMESMDQGNAEEELVNSLAGMIISKRLKVRVYTRGRLHAKAYIFDYKQVYDKNREPINGHEKGIAIVGSSNLTLAGIIDNTELNVIVQGNENHSQLVRWFEELWEESEDFDAILMNEMKRSWIMTAVKPYEIYMKTIYSLVRDRMEGENATELLWDDDIANRLADFQRVAVLQIIQMIRRYGGAFIADVVGMGRDC